jgi:hypothetical protein
MKRTSQKLENIAKKMSIQFLTGGISPKKQKFHVKKCYKIKYFQRFSQKFI